ncbi:hypothetical protein BJY04DRAFT_216928 [Aspergillus karnatakaensis]|uniref:uncharacterized protein n=1 Tax=Aspergillus karnatakaensis TaxID=1810916 RepID=UPI003CCD9093
MSFGLRIWFPSSWRPAHLDGVTGVSAYTVFRLNARRKYLASSGRPSKVTQLFLVDHIASAGEYVAWSSNSEPGPNLIPVGDIIFWQCFGKVQHNSSSSPNSILSSCLVDSDSPAVRVLELFINEDGILLVHLEGTFHGIYSARYVVYSPHDGKTLWTKDTVRKDTERHFKLGKAFPVQIGKNAVFCEKALKDSYQMSAYDFRTGRLLYSSPKHSLLDRQQKAFYAPSRRMLWTDGGKEFLATSMMWFNRAYTNTFASRHETWAQILDGETGKRIFCTVYSGIWWCSFHTIPCTECIVLVLQPSNPFLWFSSETRGPPFAIMHTLSYNTGRETSMTRLSTDVVLLHSKTPHGWVSSDNQKIALDPSTLTALSSSYVQGGRGVTGHDLVAADDEESITMAKSLLRRCCPGTEATPLNRCFVLAEGIRATLPPRRGVRRKRVELRLTFYPEVKSLTATDQGSAIALQGNNAYVFQL